MNQVFVLPVWHGALDRTQQLLRVKWIASFATAATGAGLVVGLTLGSVGSRLEVAPRNARVLADVGLVVIGLAAILLQIQGRVAPLPQRRRQVPRRWTRWRHRSLTAAAFGGMLGAGGLTYLHHAAAYAITASVILWGSPRGGALTGAAFGMTKGAMLFRTWLAGGGIDALIDNTTISAARSATAILPWVAVATLVLSVTIH